MKTLISKSGQSHNVKLYRIKEPSFFLFIALIILSIFFSSSTPLRIENQVKVDDVADKKLMILVKLEAGKDLSSEEIRSSFDEFRLNEFEAGFICGIDFQEINKQISESMKELKRNIGSFHNSEEFLSMHEELLRWNEKFKEEFEKMMQEFKQSGREKKDKEKDN
jgi:hypothetical protein